MLAQRDDQMSPDASPGDQTTRSGVRRVNNLPIYIMVGALLVFLLIMVLVASDRAAKQNLPDAKAEAPKGGSAARFARDLTGDKKDGIVQPAATVPLTPPASNTTPPPDANTKPASLEPPTPMPNAQGQAQGQQSRSPREEEAEHIRGMKLQQFDDAVKARTGVSMAASRGLAPGSAAAGQSGQGGAPASRDDTLARLAAVRQQLASATRDDPTAAYMARLEQMRAAGVGAAPAAAPATPEQSGAPSSRNDIAQFGGAGQADRWRLNSQPEAPRTPYELRAGFIIPATLISGVNSELPGQIMAQVSQDVCDTPLGKYKLIPHGSRLVGTYASDIAYGQSTILVAWQRIIFPDGKAMDIGAMPGADSAGYAGFKDQVNNHYFRLFSSAFLMSAVTAGIATSQRDSGSLYTRPTASTAMSEALGQQLGQVTAQLIAKNLNIAPTLNIRPGYRFDVIVTKDMTFSKPYTAFDY